MKCSDFSYYISEYIDDRIDMAMKKKVETHLEICKECKKEYNDLKELRALFTIKSYERPKPEYFENLKSVIKRRIIAQDVVSLREKVIKFVSQPSWAMTAAMVTALVTSLAFNYKFYVQNRQLQNGTVYAQRISATGQQLANAGFTVQAAPAGYMVRQASASTQPAQPYLVNTAGALANSSIGASPSQKRFILTTIKAKNIDSHSQAKIFQ